MSLHEVSAVDGEVITETSTQDSTRFAMLELALVVASRTNPRTSFNPEKLAELTESIKNSGVHQPVLVRPLPQARALDEFEQLPRDGGRLATHEIVSGERRYRASKAAGLTLLPAMIRDLTDNEVLEIQIVENLQRDDLSDLEEAEGYQRLCETTGITKDQVGARIGKSRSYVYTRMKLLDLTPAPREALRTGQLDGTKAVLIARIPDEKLQLKALEAALEKDHQGSPRLTFRGLQTWVQQNVMLKLASAVFPIADASLIPSAGACGECPKRTGANPDLFADVDGPDVCIDPACFHAKEEAHSAAVLAMARAKGMQVIEGKEAKEICRYGGSYLQGYTNVDERGGASATSLRDMLSPKELKQVAMLVAPDTGKLIEVVTDEVAGNARERDRAKNIDGKLSAQAKKQLEKDKEREAERERVKLAEEYQERWRKAAIDIIRPRIAAGEVQAFSANLLRRLILEISMCDQRCSEGASADVLGIAPYDDALLASTVRSLDDNQVGFTLLQVLLDGDSQAVTTWESGECVFDDSAPVIEELSGILGISLADVKAKVQAEIRAERGPEAPPANDPAAPPEGSAKGGKNSSKPAARARKTTTEEATAGIAAALQALAEPGGAQEDLATPVLKDAAGDGAAAASDLKAGDPAKAKDGTVGRISNGGTRKVGGKAGVVHMINAENSVAFRFGPATKDLVWLHVNDLEPYSAMPTIGSRVRIVKAGITAERNELLWREGHVSQCREDGWRVDFPASKGVEECYEVFGTDELEVLV